MYEHNLVQLRRRDAVLVEALESASLAEVDEVQGPRGARVLRHRGVLLGSAYDPEGEAERMADEMAQVSADLLVAIGFGLGEQLLRHVERSRMPVVVFEPSPGRLKAALHRRAFDDLFRPGRELEIATDLEQLARMLEARYRVGLRLRVFTHPAVLRLDPGPVRDALRRIQQVKNAADIQAKTAVRCFDAWASTTAANGSRIAARPGFGSLRGLFANRTAVVVAAGPSLDKQLPSLRERRDELIVIAIGQTVGALAAAGIRPDLVHVLESRDVSHQLTDAGDPGDLDLVVTPECHSALYDLPTRSCFVATSATPGMGTWIAEATGGDGFTIGGASVAVSAVGMALLLGADPILLIGQDLAFTGGRTYAAHSAYDFVGAEIDDDGRCHFTGMRQKIGLLGDRDLATVRDRVDAGEIVWVDGWHEGERLPTWRSYAVFIEEYRRLARTLSASGARLINCTEGGARLHGLEHRSFRDALDVFAVGRIDARGPIRAIYDASRPHRLSDYRPALEAARRRLDRIEKDALRADRDAERMERGRVGLRPERQRMEALRRLAAHEKKLRRRLERVPWLDVFAQQAIHHSECLSRRSDHREPNLEEIVGESRFLFRAAREAVIRARAWFEAFEASFAEGRRPAPHDRSSVVASARRSPGITSPLGSGASGSRQASSDP